MLHIVTLKDGLMINKKVSFFTLFVLCFGVWACASDDAEGLRGPKEDELVFTTEPEEIKGNIDVYKSMARAVKYNVDNASANLNKKIFQSEQNPQNVLQGILNVKYDMTTPLYEVSNALEYATIFSLAQLNNQKGFVDNLFYDRSAQHLTLAAIRTHQDAWFASRKIKEIDRLMKQQQKILTGLNERLERLGKLSNEDLEYKKGLEVALMNLEEIRKKLLTNMTDYARLTNTNLKKADFGGRRFYELEDFDKNYQLDIFQESAIMNRSEFAIAKEQVKNYSFDEVKENTNRQYEEIERLDLNGVDVDHQLYSTQLQDQARKNAEDLINSVLVFVNLKDGEEKEKARKEAFDLLGTAVLAQIKINYKLVRLSDLDYHLTEKKISDLNSKINSMEKVSRPNAAHKIEVLNLRISKLENEVLLSQINAERAVALRSLYFEAGLSPFNKKILKSSPQDIEKVLKDAFNSDVVKMLAAARQKLKEQQIYNEINDKGWAKGSDWLERLVDGKASSSPRVSEAKEIVPSDVFAPYGPEANACKIMQLGSFEKKKNANEHWVELSTKFPKLKQFLPQIERTHVDGKIWYRLIVTSIQGGFLDICNEMRAAGSECLLR